jgi:hypothetical protein
MWPFHRPAGRVTASPRRAGGPGHPAGHRLRIVGDLRRRGPLHRVEGASRCSRQSASHSL